ncbi:MAG: MoxR family ATPase [Bacteroidaceae bacterium]|nr:MoxR family ATPase [Bacteroidaceae bacterium]
MEESRMDIAEISDKVQQMKDEIGNIIVGQNDVVDLVMTCVLADGHILLEGVPGVAKTFLAKIISKLIDAKFSRIQFTPDLMPSDVLGTTVFNMKTSEFDFHAGPVFGNMILVDEINRAPAKTQAALFEAMEERQITVDGETYKMDSPYTIIATQNPVEQEGTYRLPEAQLDRFMMKISVGYPNVDEGLEILRRHQQKANFTDISSLSPVLTKENVLYLRQQAANVVIDDSLLRYIVEIVEQTRISRAVFLGASPRATVAILKCSKAYAVINGRDFVTPDDIKYIAPYVLQHRIILTAEAEMEGYTPIKVARMLIDKVEVPQ